MTQILGGVFKEKSTDNDPFRVIAIEGDKLYTISTDRRKEKETPREWSFARFKEDLKNGDIVPDEDEALVCYLRVELTEEEKDAFDREWEKLDEFWNDPEKRSGFLSKSGRWKTVGDLAAELDVSKSTALRKIVKFLKGGGKRFSLIPLTKVWPGRECKYEEKSKKRGPKNAKTNHVLTEKDMKNFEKAYKKIVLGEGKPISQAYDFCLGQDDYSYEAEDANGVVRRILLNPGDEPSEFQFRNYIEKIRDRTAEAEAKFGKIKVNNDMTVDSGSQRDGFEVRGPGSCFQVDATHLPVNLLSEIDHQSVISHPLLYTAIDVFSGLIVAFDVSMENESLNSTKLLYVKLLRDSKDVNEENGVKVTREMSPFTGALPARILADNGKAKVKNVAAINEQFGVTFSFTRSYCPRDKPFVERSHRMVKDFLRNFFDFVDKKHGKERGDKDPKENASMTLAEFRKILTERIVTYNNTIQKSYPATAQMMADGVVRTPAEIWKWGVENGLSELIDPGEKAKEYLENHLLPIVKGETRILRDDDVHVFGFIYKPETERDKLIYKRHLGERVQVRYNPLRIGYVWIDLEGETMRLEIGDQYASFKDCTLEEVQRLRKNQVTAEDGEYHRNLEKRINTTCPVRDVAAEKHANKPKSLSGSETSAGTIRDNNKREREYEREKLEQKHERETLEEYRKLNELPKDEKTGDSRKIPAETRSTPDGICL